MSKKIIDLGNLTEYDGQIKDYIANQIPSLTGYEQTNNKVTSISSSSTDTEYPSAKLLYDLLKDKLDLSNIENFETTSSRFFNFSEKEPGIYYCASETLFYKMSSGNSYNTISDFYIIYIIIKKRLEEAENNEVFGYFIGADKSNTTSQEGDVRGRELKKVISNNTVTLNYAKNINLTNLNLKYLTKGDQTITGKKIFNTLPESSGTPSTNNQLTNKSYVDSLNTQVSSMPIASSSNNGKIVQYIGTTNSNYTNGYFYKCVNNSGTYSWEEVDVQPAPSLSGYEQTSNKVTSLSSSSTDTQYPSAKSVYDYVEDNKFDYVIYADDSEISLTPNVQSSEIISTNLLNQLNQIITDGVMDENGKAKNLKIALHISRDISTYATDYLYILSSIYGSYSDTYDEASYTFLFLGTDTYYNDYITLGYRHGDGGSGILLDYWNYSHYNLRDKTNELIDINVNPKISNFIGYYTSMPTASSSYYNKIVIFTGNGAYTDYVTGCAYKCEKSGSSYLWVCLTTQFQANIASRIPSPSATYNWYGGVVFQYTGTTTSDYTQGNFYICVNSGGYHWQQLDIQQSIQYTTMPTASSSYNGKIVQYIGSSTSDYIQGKFYKCSRIYVNGQYVYSWVDAGLISSNDSISYISRSQYYYNDTDSKHVPVRVLKEYIDSSYKEPTFQIIDEGYTYLTIPSLNCDIEINASTQVMCPGGETFYSWTRMMQGSYVKIVDHSNTLTLGYDNVFVFPVFGVYGWDSDVLIPGLFSSPVLNLGKATGMIYLYSYYDDDTSNYKIRLMFRFFANDTSDITSINNVPVTKKYVDDHTPSLTGYEQTSNKVTSLSSSSTDTQYPSAKCVYDYIDDNIILKTATLPTASADNLGKIYQFVGTTTSSYINGYFYKCVSDGQTTPTYSWEEYQVQSPAPMYIMSYGNSTWDDFITAYQKRLLVYCRASSNTNPATGSQTRMAFMAYVNNADNPTEVEFQYYRSVSSHSASQQGDQVFVYKLTKTAGWSVTTRESYTKIVAGTGLTSSYSNGVLTLTNGISASDYLSKTNTTSYTPSADYHPATKKYVDDNIPTIPTDYLSTSNTTAYTPTGDYNPATKKYVDDHSSGSVDYEDIENNPVIILGHASSYTYSNPLDMDSLEVGQLYGVLDFGSSFNYNSFNFSLTGSCIPAFEMPFDPNWWLDPSNYKYLLTMEDPMYDQYLDPESGSFDAYMAYDYVTNSPQEQNQTFWLSYYDDPPSPQSITQTMSINIYHTFSGIIYFKKYNFEETGDNAVVFNYSYIYSNIVRHYIHFIKYYESDNPQRGMPFDEDWITWGVEGVSTAAQTFYGVKTFNAVPTCSTKPTSNNQLANKKYVDDAISTAITSALGGNY